TITATTFPMLATVFAKPSLLEAKTDPSMLGGVIAVRDPEMLDKLKGRKGEKLAKLWAPLILHNIFTGALDGREDPELLGALEKSERILEKASGSSWSQAFRKAGEDGIPPSLYIQRMPIGAKQMLNVGKGSWERSAAAVEAELSKWIVASAGKLKNSFEAIPTEGAVVSLKRLSKFSARAR
ncbi:MAG: hypothetical protein GX771_09820, partial [Halomonadaceae bacterium]|nr:hypothetical protein [Halomonadaceae bacterium]